MLVLGGKKESGNWKMSRAGLTGGGISVFLPSAESLRFPGLSSMSLLKLLPRRSYK